MRRLPATVIERIILIEAYRRQLVAHSGKARQAAQLLAVEAVRRALLLARSVAQTHRIDVDRHHIGRAHQRLRTHHIALDGTQTVGVKVQLVHQLHQSAAVEIGLIANIREVKQIVRLLRNHVAQPVAAVERFRVRTQVKHRVDTCHIHHATQHLVGLIVRERQILAAAKNNHRDILLKQLVQHLRHRKTRVLGRSPGHNVAQVNHLHIIHRHCQLVKIAAYLVRPILTALVANRPTVVTDTQQGQSDILQARERPFLGINLSGRSNVCIEFPLAKGDVVNVNWLKICA